MTQQASVPAGTVEGLRQSRIGKRPVELPKGVTVTLKDGNVEVKGPKGTLARRLPDNVSVKVEGTTLTVLPTIPGRDGARFQGLARALINSMVVGSSTGYTKTLQLVGTGYRAELKGQVLNLSLGFSHPVNFPVPAGIKVEIPGDSKGTLVILTGADKEKMGETAAKIRGFRPPEPYGGKGVRYQGEKVREKAGKAGAKGGK
ncbi:50S ribosomal protein L6 [Pendulispora brunnea]|uniref:Large ribosomal subunit protein uL6 n=1 Tax=Pendulispora brunnea TaxID=2905690 RepID=A0ABZ2K0S6_9BACT